MMVLFKEESQSPVLPKLQEYLVVLQMIFGSNTNLLALPQTLLTVDIPQKWIVGNKQAVINHAWKHCQMPFESIENDFIVKYHVITRLARLVRLPASYY